MSKTADTDVLDRVLDPLTQCLTVDVARRIVDLRADDATQARVDQLADRASEGALTGEERREYESYRSAMHLVTILQAKARTLLKNESPD